MNNVEMTPQQAAQEVIKLKKAYAEKNTPNSGFHATDEAKALTSQADYLRQKYGLDESRYGRNVSIADAYMYYLQDFGGQQTQQQPQQVQQQVNPQNIQNFWQNTSNSFYDSQKALFDKQLSEQITNLQIAYNQAINEGKLSINEAKEQFEEQKKALEQLAYQQYEATKARASSMGFAHSGNMEAMHRSDYARINSLHNENAKARDRRINEIRDRINQITMEKDLKLTDAKSQYYYNLAGAKAQADQMYNQSMGQFMVEDYFTGRKEQHDYNMQDRQWEIEKEKMALTDYYYTKNLEYASKLKIDEMYVGHKLDLEKMDKELENFLIKIAEEHGYNVDLENIKHSHELSRILTTVKAQAKAADEEYEKTKQRTALSLGLSADATEWEITQESKRQAREDRLEAAKDARDAAILDSIVMGATQYMIDKTFNHPDLELNPKKPTDYRDIIMNESSYNKNIKSVMKGA